MAGLFWQFVSRFVDTLLLFQDLFAFFSLECGRARFSVDSVNGGSVLAVGKRKDLSADDACNVAPFAVI